MAKPSPTLLFDVYPFDLRPIPPHGVLSSAAGASVEKVVQQIVPNIAAALRDYFAAM